MQWLCFPAKSLVNFSENTVPYTPNKKTNTKYDPPQLRQTRRCHGPVSDIPLAGGMGKTELVTQFVAESIEIGV